MRIAILALTAALVANPAYADVFSYRCTNKGKSYLLKVDDARNELTFRGKTYKINVQESCAKFGWRAERLGESIDFCTATQGIADFGPYDCQQKQ